MSADYISAAVYLSELNPAERKKRMYAAIDLVNQQEWDVFFKFRGEETPDTQKELHEYMEELIDNFILAIEAPDVGGIGIVNMPGYVVFTGGNSWGEDPTGSFDALCNTGEWPEAILVAGGIDQPVNLLEEAMKDKDMPNSLKKKIRLYMAAKAV